ncbi:MAG: CYTH domain-containing protein [Cyanobium sp.]
MALEIERRFLVSGDDWRRHVCSEARLQQGYLAVGADGLTVRVRCASGVAEVSGAWLTLKGRSPSPALELAGQVEQEGLVRQEFEYSIPAADAAALLALAPHRLSKCRFELDLPGGEWVLDVFDGDNAPLVVAEVELDVASFQKGLEVELPIWCVRELTGQHEFSNAALSRLPLAQWPEAQRFDVVQALGSNTKKY